MPRVLAASPAAALISAYQWQGYIPALDAYPGMIPIVLSHTSANRGHSVTGCVV
jgi:hypothetical protein